MAGNERYDGRRLTRREMLKGVAGGALTAMLASCAAPAQPQPQQAGQKQPAVTAAPAAASTVEVTWASWIYEPWNNLLSAQCMQYMGAHPNTRVVYSPLPYNELNTKYVTALASGKPYDIMGIYGPWMPQFLDPVSLDPAPDDIVQDITDNCQASFKTAATFKGKVWGYVAAPGTVSPIINIDLLKDNGIADPDSWDDMLAASQKLDKKGADGKWTQLGTALTASRAAGAVWIMIHYSSVLFPYGGKWLDADNKKAAFNSPEALAALKLYKNFTHPDAPPGMWESGKLGVGINGPWVKSAWKESAPKLNYKAIPAFKGPVNRSIAAYTWFWCVPAASKPEVKKAAWDVLKYASAPEQQVAQYRIVGLLPISKTVPKDFDNDAWLQTHLKNAQYAVVYYPYVPNWEKIENAIAEEFERYFVDEIKPEAALKNAEDKVNALLKG